MSKTQITLGVLLLFVAARIALPFAATSIVNKKFSRLSGVHASVDKVRFSLYKGAVRFVGLHVQDPGEDTVLFIPLIDADLNWWALLHKSLLIAVNIRDPRLSFVLPQAIEASQARAVKAKAQELPASQKLLPQIAHTLIPFRVDSFVIHNGQIRIEDTQPKPPEIIWLKEIEFSAQNLTNSRKLSESLLATANLNLVMNVNAKMEMQMSFNPFAAPPQFDLKARVTQIHLPDLNSLYRHQFGLTVDSGTLTTYAEAAAADGAFRGYVQPEVKELKVANPNKGKPLKTIEKAVIQAVTHLLESSEKKIAARLVLEGKFENPKISLGMAVLTVLNNAFGNSLGPPFNKPINIRGVSKEATPLKKK